MKHFLLLLFLLSDEAIFFGLLYLAISQLLTHNYIEGSALIIAVVFWQRAWRDE